jgi:hypothetical protein
MTPTASEPPTDADAAAGAPASGHERDPFVLGVPGVLWVVVAVVAAYAVLWGLGRGPIEHVYTAEWVSRRIGWFFAPSTLLLAVLSRRVLPAAVSILGLVLGVVVGESIGGRIFADQAARLELDLATRGLQSWEPVHPGWWIASLVFVVFTVAGAVIAWRSTHRAPSSRTGRPR